MHTFNEAQWRLDCEKAVVLSKFCTDVAVEMRQRRMQQVAAINKTPERQTAEYAVAVALLNASLPATVWSHQLHAVVSRQIENLALDHQPQAESIAREYGYLTEDELDAQEAWNAAHLRCIHGHDGDFCPYGCSEG